MPIADGEPADDGDIWFRVLTEDSYIKKGKIYPNAFKGRKTIAAPDPAKQRQWSHELSGALHSLVSDVVAAANAYCEEMTRVTKQTKTFSGVSTAASPKPGSQPKYATLPAKVINHMPTLRLPDRLTPPKTSLIDCACGYAM